VLPIEQVYGQAPLLSMSRGRCPACEVCTPRGCLDLAGDKALVQAIGPARRTTAWLATPHGIFLAALPGFIVGYSLLADGPLATAPRVYATTLRWSAASVALVVALAVGTRLGTAD
jgi:nitrite reductase (NADH) large subunit